MKTYFECVSELRRGFTGTMYNNSQRAHAEIHLPYLHAECAVGRRFRLVPAGYGVNLLTDS